MKFLVQGIVIAVIAASTVFGGCKEDLDNLSAQINDERMISKKLKEEAKKANDENASLKKDRDAAVKDKDLAVKQAEDLKTKNAELEKKNKELSANASQYEANSGTLQTLANDNNRLATENANLKNQIASMSMAVSVPVAPVEKFLYPVSGVLTSKSASGNVIVADFVFSNNGSRTITTFDSVLKFYVQGRKIYEITLPNVKNPTGSAFGRDETIRFRAGLPVTDQNLVNAPVEAIDLVVEVTKIQ